MNKAILCGHLGADPELRHTPNGMAVLELRLATNESWINDLGEKKERTDWHNVVIWGRRAEGLEPHLRKGMPLVIEGQIRTSSYDDKNGIKRYKTEIHASRVDLVGGGKARRAERDEPAAPPQPTEPDASASVEYDDVQW